MKTTGHLAHASQLILAFALCTAAAFAPRTASANFDWTLSAYAVGGRHACSIDTDNLAYCSGTNDFGQVGDGTTVTRLTRNAVTGLIGTTQALALGEVHSCALNTDGLVQCWGHNGYGQVGDGTAANKLVPTTVTGLAGPAAQIFAGNRRTCAVLRNGAVQCWGENTDGALGLGYSGGNVLLPTTVSGLPQGVLHMAVGANRTCAVVPDGGGTVRCWGRHLLDGNLDINATDVPGLTGVARVAIGYAHACAMLANGTVSCWGDNSTGQLGINTFDASSETPVQVVNLGGNARDIAATTSSTCVVLDTGAVRCWGSNVSGELGDNGGIFGTTTSNSRVPVTVYGLPAGIRSIHGAPYGTVLNGGNAFCALTVSGRGKCWGVSGLQAGDGTNNSTKRVPANVGFSGRYPTMGLGANHTCTRTWGLNARCWGSNADGQVGEAGTPGIQSTPLSLSSFGATMPSVSSGEAHSCAPRLTSPAGNVVTGVCWGANDKGQLGNGTTTPSQTPVTVSGLDGSGLSVNQITSGARHACAVLTNGNVRCWGDNSRGQLGNGTTTQSLVPVTVSTGSTPLANVVEVRAGAYFTCARISNGAVRCWGANDRGQLGNNSTADANTALNNFNLTAGVASITVGAAHACATIANSLVCWGENADGQLGLGNLTTAFSTTPITPVATYPSTLVRQVAAGGRHTCLIAMDGRAWCWGANDNGQLGDGTFDPHYSPQPVNGPLGVEGIYAGASHTCAVLLDGRLTCWGANNFGQLGNGDTSGAAQNTPQSVPGFGQAMALDAPAETNPGLFFATAATNVAAFTPTIDVLTPSNCSGAAPNFTATAGGDCLLIAKHPGDASYFPAASHTRVVKVRHTIDAMVFNALPDREIDQTPFTVTATLQQNTGGFTVSYRSFTPSVCTLSGQTVSLVGLGRCAIQASTPGNATYAPQAETRSFNVGPALPDQTIDFPAIADHALYESPVAIAATATSGQAVAFTSLTQAVCTVSGTTVTLLATGTCTIRATQDGGGTYSPAPPVDRSFTVLPNPVATLNVARAGQGTGTVTSDLSGISCGGDCTEDFSAGTVVTLTATPDAGFYFRGWSGGGCAGAAPCTLTLAAGVTNVTATFSPPFEVMAQFRLGDDDPGAAIGQPANAITQASGFEQLYRTGTPQYVAGAAAQGIGILFNGTTDGYGIETVPSNDTDDIGIEAWVKASAASGNGVIAWIGQPGVNGFGIMRVGNLTRGYVGGTAVGSPFESVTGTDLTHVAFVRTNGTWHFYMNGFELGTSGAAPSEPYSTNTSVGYDGGSAGFYGGLIDEVRVFRFQPGTFATSKLNLRRLIADRPLGAPASVVVTSSPPGGFYPVGTPVHITVNLPAQYEFTNYNTNCAVTVITPSHLECDVTMTNDFNLFLGVREYRTFTILKNGTGTGRVIGFSDAFRLDCGPTCTTTLTPNGAALVKAIPDAGSVFAGWTPDCSLSADECIQAMNGQDRTVTATFNLVQQSQSITFDPLGDRSLAQTPFTVSATASSGLAVAFESLTMGVCTVTANSVALLTTGTCTIRATQGGSPAYLPADPVDRSFTVTPTQYTLTVITSGNGSVSGPGIDCGTTCSAILAGGTTVMLTATAGSGSTFAGWSGACTGTGPCSFTLDADRTVTASFTLNAPAKPSADFDGNGKGDLLFRNADGRGAIWLMNGLTIASSAEIFPAGTNWAVAQIADLNGDGKADLVWANPDGRVTVYLMDGTTATLKQNLLPAGGGWSVVGTGDLDGDGKADIVFQNVDGTVAAYLMNGALVTSGATILGPGTGWTVSLVADFDGDGKKDLFFTHSDGRAAIYLMNGLTPTATVQILNAGTGWTATHTADLNGDGKADIVWHNADGRTAVWLMNGTTMTSGTELLGAATGWAVTRVGDFDGDGKADLVFEHTDGRVAIYLMNGITPTATTQILNAGGGWSVRRVADLDGDGKADIVWENVDGRLAIWLMNGTAMASGAGVLGPGTGWRVSPVSQGP
ncbi:hypothetical protein BWI17_13150 [Betaproteobacteria bacterium GR16-43]|nr:hypothetical protein BWI17_13150 [Betaproteobacteria bacterium GR16-43]